MRITRKWYVFLTVFILLGFVTGLALTVHFTTLAYAHHRTIPIAIAPSIDSKAVPMGSTEIASNYFAPYIDISADTGGKTLTQLVQESGVKYFTLSFIEAANGCTPEWGGANVTLDNDNNPQNGTAVIANTVKQQIADLQNAGGNVVISFGGESADNTQNGELGQACTDATSLEQAYQSVVDHYNIDHIDFDIEGKVSTDLLANARRDQAIKQLVQIEKNKGINLSVSFTVPVVKEGLVNDSNSSYPSDGLDVVQSAISDQVPVNVFNIMTMYYGSECNNCDMGNVAGQSADAVAKQLSVFYSQNGQTLTQSQIYRQIGITPIIDNPTGVVASESSISTSGTQELLQYAQSQHIGELSMWDFKRDMQHQFAYSKILTAFSDNQSQNLNQDQNQNTNQKQKQKQGQSLDQGQQKRKHQHYAQAQSNVKAWASDNTLYNPGDRVSYKGHVWLCKQQIWGQAQWTPDAPGIQGQYWIQDDSSGSDSNPNNTTTPNNNPTVEPTTSPSNSSSASTTTTTTDGKRLKVMVTFYNDIGAMADGQQTHRGACAVYSAQFKLGTTFDLYASATATTPAYHCTAEDTGTEVCSNHVDVFLPLSTSTLMQMGAPSMYLQLTGVNQTVVQEAADNHPNSMGCETGHNPQ
ncbi:hypothetical protein [Dictyobacter arantiisoli]|uniref:GH18 domain-containing protein n=1 Tax=Dictyobacter arantiisoli TaxID=2014874 RepID=A0A5A5TIT1_9CHLR|nr:hypothetical protein [Dictyobacter arantiisoli]GCF11135.1 hypothetical protein KDI_46990 [Dictyobacter arantiisoli]